MNHIVSLSSLVVASLAVSTPPAIANPYTLKCTLDTGESTSDLIVDLDRRMMKRGAIGCTNCNNNYKITSVTDRYITAMQSGDISAADAVGGEIFVVDRLTGDYKQANVGIFCNNIDTDPHCHVLVLRAFASLGRCIRPIL